MKVLLQDAAWSESSRQAKRDVRRRAMAQHAVTDDLDREPLFCMETALKVHVISKHFLAVQVLIAVHSTIVSRHSTISC